MSTYHRTTHTERDALYQPVPQAEDQAEDLQIGEDDEDGAVEDFVTQEHLVSHDKRVGWIHFILGCAVLLPWNGTSPPAMYVLLLELE